MDWAAVHGCTHQALRIGKILVGAIELEEEEKLFDFLCKVENDMLIDKTDELGCSKHVEFSIELISDDVKPVCHDVRRCSRPKQAFVDE